MNIELINILTSFKTSVVLTLTEQTLQRIRYIMLSFQRLFMLFLTTSCMVCINFAEILRLPCRLHGNFSVRQKGKYLTQVPILRTLSVSSAKICVIHCIGHDTCQHVNYQNSDKQCELLDVGNGTLVNKTGSEYLTTETDEIDETNHGPFCKSVDPCSDLEDCFDSCEDKGYRCQELQGLLKKNHIVKQIAALPKIFNFSVDIRPIKIRSVWANVIQATTGEFISVYGSRVPVLSFWPGTFNLHICFAVSGNNNYQYNNPTPLPTNKFTTIKIEQTFEGGQYVYRIYRDGKKDHETVNSQPMKFDNVTLYASNPWENPAFAVIKNLMFGKLLKHVGNV